MEWVFLAVPAVIITTIAVKFDLDPILLSARAPFPLSTPILLIERECGVGVSVPFATNRSCTPIQPLGQRFFSRAFGGPGRMGFSRIDYLPGAGETRWHRCQVENAVSGSDGMATGLPLTVVRSAMQAASTNSGVNRALCFRRVCPPVAAPPLSVRTRGQASVFWAGVIVRLNSQPRGQIRP
jgi:hypothetical protein